MLSWVVVPGAIIRTQLSRGSLDAPLLIVLSCGDNIGSAAGSKATGGNTVFICICLRWFISPQVLINKTAAQVQKDFTPTLDTY